MNFELKFKTAFPKEETVKFCIQANDRKAALKVLRKLQFNNRELIIRQDWPIYIKPCQGCEICGRLQ